MRRCENVRMRDAFIADHRTHCKSPGEVIMKFGRTFERCPRVGGQRAPVSRGHIKFGRTPRAMSIKWMLSIGVMTPRSYPAAMMVSMLEDRLLFNANPQIMTVHEIAKHTGRMRLALQPTHLRQTNAQPALASLNALRSACSSSSVHLTLSSSHFLTLNSLLY